MRISGFASGLDIDTMVKELMAAKRQPLNKLNQQKKTLEWQREQFRDLNIKMIDFRNNKLFNYGLNNTLSAKQVSVTGNTGAVSAKTTGSAVAGNMTVEVTELAVASSVEGITQISKSDMDKTLAEFMNLPPDAGEQQPNPFTITFNKSAAPHEEIVSLTFSADDTVASVIAKINASSPGTIYVDSQTGNLNMTAKKEGEENTLNFSGDLMDKLFGAAGVRDVKQGKDAILTINGISTTRSSNTFTENGIEITLNSKTNGVAAKLNVTSNTDKIMDTIKSFIKDYNDLLESVNNKLGEERFRKFSPLTDDQRKEMKEDEIKLWEDKAKSGLLRNDVSLSALVNSMRLSSMTSVKVGDKEINLASLGIETAEWGERGKLVLKNEDKLRAAIEENPDEVLKFFTQQSTLPEKADPDDPNASQMTKNAPGDPEAGLFNRLSKAVMNAIEGLAEKAGTSRFSMDEKASFSATSLIGKRLRDLDMQLSTETARMVMLENSYYKKFTAMEKAINRFSSQSSSLFGFTQ